MRPAMSPARCPDCDQLVTPPAGASGPTTARCGRCAYVLLLFTPRLDYAAVVTEATGGGRPVGACPGTADG